MYRKIQVRFFDHLFFVPKTLRNVQILQRIEKEKLTIELIHEKFSRPNIYIDIGVNVGYWTFARKHILKDSIKFYCFEPSSLNFMYLKKNLEKFNNYVCNKF